MASEISDTTKTDDLSKSSGLSVGGRKSSGESGASISEDKSASTSKETAGTISSPSSASSSSEATFSGPVDNVPLPTRMFARVVLPYRARVALQYFLILVYVACMVAMGYVVVHSGFSIFDAVKVSPTLPTKEKVALLLLVLVPTVCIWLTAGYALNVLNGLHVKQLQRATIVVFNVSIFVLLFMHVTIMVEENGRHDRIVRHLMKSFEKMRSEGGEYALAVNFIQGEFHCCGVGNPRSWHSVGANFTEKIADIDRLSFPWSCCIRDVQSSPLCGNGVVSKTIEGSFDNETVFAKGCDGKLESLTHSVVENMRFVTPIVLWSMLVSAVLMLYLANAMRYLYRYCESDTDTTVTWILAWGKK
ncbi:Tetraspannin domain containing protein [Trichuris trichiura]|uniref:Tetraspannin domain containing protein n=1 Tax=Trichuris trichiura TaxID=36087 RepID=A0A077ZFI7_TRITR|nr:Tetraspannin domain containing protein [Trichuris trichiura]